MTITKQTFIDKIDAIYKLDTAAKKLLLKSIQTRLVKKNRDLVNNKQPASGIYCLQEGYLSFGYEINGELKFRKRVKKGDLCTLYMSLLMGKPSLEIIRAKAGVKILYLEFTILKKLCSNREGLFLALLAAGSREHTRHLETIRPMPIEKTALFYKSFIPAVIKYRLFVTDRIIKITERTHQKMGVRLS